MRIKLQPQRWLILWLLAMGILTGWLYAYLHIVNDISQFMPAAEQDLALQALINEMQSGPAASTLMLRLSGGEARELAKLSTQLRQALRPQKSVSDAVADVVFEDVRNTNRGFDHDALAALFAYRYLLIDTPGWSEQALEQTLRQRLSDLRAGAGVLVGDYLTTDPQLSFINYMQRIFNTDQQSSGPQLKHGVWFDQQLKSALMLVKVRGESLDLDMMQSAQNEILSAFAQLDKTASVRLETSGPGIMAVESRARITQLINRLSVFMTILLMIVFGVAYRNLGLLVLAILPLSGGIIVALVITQLIFNQVHGIVLAFGITLLGVCLDYPLHLFSHLRVGEKPSQSLKKIWPTLFLSALTTVLAYLALLGSGFSGLSQLGVFAASGLSVALLTTRYILPLQISSEGVRSRYWQGYWPGYWSGYWPGDIHLSALHKTVLVLLFLALPVSIILQAETIWETSIDAISPVPASARERDGALRHDLNVPEVSHVFLQSGRSLQAVLQASEHIEQQLLELRASGGISSIWSPARVLPSAQRQMQRQRELPTNTVFSARLDTAVSELAFRRDAFAPWQAAVLESHSLAPLDYTTIAPTPLGDVLRQGLFQHQGVWISTIRISGIRSDTELTHWLKAHPLVSAHHVEIKTATEHLLIEYRISTFERFMGVVILLVLIILFCSRSLHKTLWILLPPSIGLLRVFNDDIVCSSTKGFTGHTLGAAGIVEAIISVLALEQGLLPANLNMHNCDQTLGVLPLEQAAHLSVENVMSNSSGFGGNNCSLIFGW